MANDVLLEINTCTVFTTDFEVIQSDLFFYNNSIYKKMILFVSKDNKVEAFLKIHTTEKYLILVSHFLEDSLCRT